MADRKLKFTLDFLAKTAGLKDASALLAEVGDEFDDTADAGKKFAAALRVAADRVESDLEQTKRAADVLAEALGPEMANAIGRAKIDEYAAQMRQAGLSVDDVEQNVTELADGIRRLSGPADTADELAGSFDDVGQSAGEAGNKVGKASDRMSRSLDDASNSADDLNNQFSRLGKGVLGGVAFAQVISFTKDLVKATAELEDTAAAAGVTFGKYSDQVEAFAKSAASNYGISTRAALEAANRFAALGASAGKSGQDLATFATQMVALAGDISSFSGAPIEEAILAIGSGLRGEAEPLRRFGVLLDDATLKARAMQMGIGDGTSTLTAQQKVLAAHAEILAQTGNAQGDFARTADSTANSLKTASAEMENAKAAAGEALAPAMAALAQSLTPVLEGFSQLPNDVQTVITILPIATGMFVSGSKALQGLGVSTKTANVLMGGLAGTIGLATATYSIYAQKKALATQRTKDFISALKLEGTEQDNALRALFDSDEEFKSFIQNLNSAGLSLQDVEQYLRSGTGAVADFVKEINNQSGLDKINSWTDIFINTKNPMDTFRDDLEALRAEAVAQTAAQADLNKATTSGIDITDRHAQGMKDSADAADANADAQLNSADATEEHNKAIQEQIDLRNELYENEYSLIERMYALRDAQERYNEVMADTSSTVDEQFDAIKNLVIKYGELEGASDGSRSSQQRQIESLEVLLGTIDKDSPLYKAVYEYLSLLKQIPSNVNTTLGIVMPATPNTKLNYGPISFAPSSTTTDSPYRALGGPVSANSMYQVAEGGMPELLTDGKGRTYLIPGTDGVVTPISSATASTSAVGGQTFNITITNPLMSGEQLANELKAYIRRNGSGWLS